MTRYMVEIVSGCWLNTEEGRMCLSTVGKASVYDSDIAANNALERYNRLHGTSMYARIVEVTS